MFCTALKRFSLKPTFINATCTNYRAISVSPVMMKKVEKPKVKKVIKKKVKKDDENSLPLVDGTEDDDESDDDGMVYPGMSFKTC